MEEVLLAISITMRRAEEWAPTFRCEVARTDVEEAFNNLSLDAVLVAMSKWKAHPSLVLDFLREMQNLEATAVLPGAST